MIGLEAYRPDLTEYRECIDVIEKHVKRYTAAELEVMNKEIQQAGVTALKWEDFKETSHVCSFFARVDLLFLTLMKIGQNTTLSPSMATRSTSRFIPTLSISRCIPRNSNFKTPSLIRYPCLRTLSDYCRTSNGSDARRIWRPSHQSYIP